MKKILVTGAGGFVGSRVVQQWAGRYELCTFPKGFLATAREDAVRQAVLQQRPDGILHTAAISDTGYCADHPEQAYRANVELPGYRLPIRGNLPLNLLRAAQRGESVRFSVRDFRGITYVRQAVALLEAALTLPGGVYNFGSENAENMVLTARQFAETLGITVDIQEADWVRNLAMDCSKLQAHGIVFDTTQAGLTRCLRDYGLL